MLHDFMKQRSTSTPTSIRVMTPMGMPIPISPVASEKIVEELRARDIEFCPETVVTSLDPASRTATLARRRLHLL